MRVSVSSYWSVLSVCHIVIPIGLVLTTMLAFPKKYFKLKITEINSKKKASNLGLVSIFSIRASDNLRATMSKQIR